MLGSALNRKVDLIEYHETHLSFIRRKEIIHIASCFPPVSSIAILIYLFQFNLYQSSQNGRLTSVDRLQLRQHAA